MNWKFKLLKLSTYNSLINQSMSKDIIISNQSKQLKAISKELKDNIDKLKSLNVYLRLLELDKIEAKSKSYQQITTLEEMICTLQKSNEKLKDKLSKTNTGRVGPNTGKELLKSRKPISAINKKGDIEFFDSGTQMNKIYSIGLCNINSCLKGRQKSTHGWTKFEYR